MANILNTKRKTGTATSSFGILGRINHDSSKFYNSKMYKGLNNGNNKVKYIENHVPENIINKIFYKSSEKMEELPDSRPYL